MTDTATVTAQRPYVKGVDLLFFGLMTVQGDLMPAAQRTKDVEFKLVCPSCDDPAPLTQQYFCEEGHGPYTTGNAGRAKVVGSGKAATLHKVTAEQIEALKSPTLPTGEMTVHVFPAVQVEQHTIPSGSAYRLRSTGRADLYAVLVDLVKDTDMAFVGEMTVKGTQKMWRISSRHGQLLLSELIRPEEVAPGDDLDAVEYDAAALDMVSKLAAKNVEEFDPTAFRNTIAERARAMNEALAAGKGEEVPTVAPTVAPEETDLMALLTSAVADATPAKKAPAKKAPAKK